MKKLYAIALLGLMVLGLAATASAADIKASGKWQIEANMQNADFMDKGASTSEDKTFNIEQRVRTAFQFIANENLKGVLDLQIGAANWGTGALGIGAGRSASLTATGAASAGNGNIMLRKGYVDFKWPGTKVNFLVGFQTVSLPAAFGGGSAILDDQVAAALVSTPITDNISLLAGYARPYDTNSSVSTTAGNLSGSGTSGDVVFAAVPLNFKGVNVTPFAAYASLGSKLGAPGLVGLVAGNSTSGEGARAYFGGVAATVTMLDNFKFMGDFNYGKATFNSLSTPNLGSTTRSGWMADIAVDYTGLKMMTPSAFFVYSSGEKGNSTEHAGSNRMPSLGNPQNWAVGSFFFGDRNFINGFPGSAGYVQRVMGFWTAGVSLKDIKLIDKMTHTAHLLYVKGTNDKNSINEDMGNNINLANNMNYGGFLTTKDSLWEVDFNTKYMIYDELAVNLDLGYINANFDKDLWGASSKTAAADYQNYGSNNAYSARLGVAYSF
ncbi:MAG: outer membrane homotrimeric porin [Humidesulfovibrio sp.]|uniref:outer membrane homotrimeric porin n=1 Tax=Humidesulfovibrio sp. TaxID=2910988 RepID=UPI0027E94F89|nr:outer membrane homotrimeric porin [Humidesulfovibrio sp.]MDQ7834206.1 outer membrane homotrimeric porin [Humidesulfovibrio sp.]